MLSTSCFMVSFCFSDFNEIAIVCAYENTYRAETTSNHSSNSSSFRHRIHQIIIAMSSWGFLMNKQRFFFWNTFSNQRSWEWSHNWYIVVGPEHFSYFQPNTCLILRFSFHESTIAQASDWKKCSRWRNGSQEFRWTLNVALFLKQKKKSLIPNKTRRLDINALSRSNGHFESQKINLATTCVLLCHEKLFISLD